MARFQPSGGGGTTGEVIGTQAGAQNAYIRAPRLVRLSLRNVVVICTRAFFACTAKVLELAHCKRNEGLFRVCTHVHGLFPPRTAP